MKNIGNIYLVWRKGPGARRIPVGLIKKNNSLGVRFEYIQKNLDKAYEDGFIPYTGFPNTDEKYSENVLEIFSQRLSKSGRNDLSEFYSFWKVKPELMTDAYYMLSQTQGLLPIDNFEFLTDFNPHSDLNFITEVAGLSKTNIKSDKIFEGDSLEYELEQNNVIDKYAVKVLKDGEFIGYIKLIHSRVFHKSKRKLSIKAHHIEKNGVITRLFIDVNL